MSFDRTIRIWPMGSVHAKIAALRRLSENDGATGPEKENALRRIKEIEEKHGLKSKPDGSAWQATFRGGPVSMADVIEEFFRGMGIPPDVARGFGFGGFGEQPFGYPPRHPNFRCHTEPMDPMTGAGGERAPRTPPPRSGGAARHPGPAAWIPRDWVEYKRKRAPGRYGRVDSFEMHYSDETGTTRFEWKCPRCGKPAYLAIADELMMYARNERAARHQIGRELFTRLNGESDNYCPECSRNTASVRFNGRRLSEFADYVMNRWRDYERAGVDQGPYGKVGNLGRNPVTDEKIIFQWRCRICGSTVCYDLHWRKVHEAIKVGAQTHIEDIIAELFRVFSGYDDNRCNRCREI